MAEQTKDAWVSVNLTTVFPAMSTRISASADLLNAQKLEFDAVIASVNQKALAVNESLEVTANLMDALTQSGYNQLLMPPKPEPFATRIATATNKPDDRLSWTAGVVLTVQGANIQEVQEKYQALIDILTTTT